MDREFEEDAVLDSLNSLNGDKAPGMDGFPIAFF